MKLITETTHDVELIKENVEGSASNYYISGVFMQAEQKNRNGRIYPKTVLMNEVKKYNKDFVVGKRAMGELGHPEGPTVNLERVSHIITDLYESGNDVMGKAKIMDTPYGKIVKNLLDEGARLGVSTRGMGSLTEKNGTKYVDDDFMLAAVDIVADPSAPSAFVDGIMEGKEWVWNNGLVVEKTIDIYKKSISDSSSESLDEVAAYCFADFLSKL
ncbi:MAG: primosomal protein [Proteobacteria bacterium]|nr:primosomal protein [Pseudomonadota bacterium]